MSGTGTGQRSPTVLPAVGRAVCSAVLMVWLGLTAGCRSGLPSGSPQEARLVPELPPPPVPAPAEVAEVPERTAREVAPEGDTGSARAESSRREIAEATCTVAVLCADDRQDPGLTAFLGLWEAAQVLCPRHVVVLGEVGFAEGGRLRSHGLSVPIAGGARAGEHIAFPGYPAASALERLRVDCGHGILLFLSAPALRRDLQEQLAWLRANLVSGPDDAARVLFFDCPVWDSDPGLWAQVRNVFEAAGGGHVFCGASQRFSWWQDGRLQCQSVRPASAPSALPPSVADGEFTGLLWITMEPQATTWRVIDPLTVQPPQVFARRFQEERRALHASLQASAILAADGITEVRCANPTDAMLTFDAEWHFDGNAGRVEPQMLGFSLGPGQAFRQRFHLQTDGDLPLKFAAPRLRLRTTCRDGLGQSVPVRLEVLPHVRLGGPLGQLGDAFAADGDLGDWPFGGLPINHESQVVLQREAWRGATDFSGTLYMGEQEGRLCAAVAVRHQPGDAVGCLLLIDLRTTSGGEYEPGDGPLTVSVSPKGQVTIHGASADAVRAAWKPAADGGILEVAVAADAFEGGQLPPELLADVVLTRDGLSGDPVTRLCLSGDGQGLRNSCLYARLQRLPRGNRASTPGVTVP